MSYIQVNFRYTQWTPGIECKLSTVSVTAIFFLFQICAFCVGISKSALSFDDSLEEPAWLRNAVFSVIVYYNERIQIKISKANRRNQM